MDQLPYNDFGHWLRTRFPFRVQKISIDAGLSCPNRDGRISRGGCSYCDNSTFSPAYCNRTDSIAKQMQRGKEFFARKYPEMKYLAYFQSFTNTYAPTPQLMDMYAEALQVADCVGLVVGTRPDCVSDELLDGLARLAKERFVLVEYGVETANDDTLRRINRGHTFATSRSAIERTKARGISVGAHIIIGLPGEDAAESISQAPIISSLPIDILKMHQLQVIRGTRLAQEYAEHPFHIYTADEYIDVVTQYVERLRKDLVLERFVSQSPKEKVVAPHWGLKNHEFADRLVGHMRTVGARQGRLAATQD